MAREADSFDPEAREKREFGREITEDPADLGSLVGHLYRAEVDREVNWRTRLDSTTNWAVTIIAGILAYAFSSENVSHAIILVAMLIGIVFLVIESRRFQRYDIWRSRVRSMQENLFANALDPSQGVERRDWRRQLSEDYRRPTTKMSLRDALVHRLRRVYLPLLSGLGVVWLVRLAGADESLLAAASVEALPGWAVVGAVLAGFLALFVLALWPGGIGPDGDGRGRGPRRSLAVSHWTVGGFDRDT